MSRTQRIKRLLADADQPLSTNQVAERIGVDWHTAKKELDELYEKNQIYRSEVSETQTQW